MKHKISISNINDAFIEDEFLYFSSDCKVVKQNLITNQRALEFVAHFEIFRLHSWKNYLILKDNLNNSIFLDKSTFKRLDNQIEEFRLSNVQNEFAFIYQKDPVKRQGVYSLLENRIVVLTQTFLGNNVANDFFYGLYHDAVHFYNKDSGNPIQRIDFGAKALLYSKGNKVLLNRRNSISEVDLSTKEIISTWSNFDKEYVVQKMNSKHLTKISRLQNANAVYLEESKKVVGFEASIFFEINMDTKMFNVKPLFEEFSAQQISGNWTNFVEHNGNLYCISDQNGDWILNNNHLVFEYSLFESTIKSTWQLPIENDSRRGFNIEGIKMSIPYIYVKEQSGNLHVIEM